MTSKQNKTIDYADKAMFFGCCAMTFFLPISNALVESFFGVILLSFLIKRTAIFIELKRSSNLAGFLSKIKLFFKSYKPAATQCNYAIFLYIFAAFLSAIFGKYPIISFEGLVSKLLEGIIIFWIFVEAISSRDRFKIWLTIFLGISFVVINNGIFQYIFKKGFVHGYSEAILTEGRIQSCFKHSNKLAGYLVFVIPILLSRFIQFIPTFNKRNNIVETKTKRTSLLVKRIFYGVFFLAGLICLGLTFSRSAWIAIIASFIFMVWGRRRITIVLAICISLFLMIFIPKMLKERKINTTGEDGIFNTSSRPQYWSSALIIIKENPIFGTGINTYSKVGREYEREGKIEWGGYPHNCYLQMWAELGILGLLAFFWILYRIFSSSINVLRQCGDKKMFNLLLGVLAGFLGFLVHSFFDTNFYAGKIAVLMWIMIGIIMVLQRIINQPDKIFCIKRELTKIKC